MGFLLDFKIVEEWDFFLGEDACLFEDEGVVDRNSQEKDFEQLDSDENMDVDVLVTHIAKDWEEPINSKQLSGKSSHHEIIDVNYGEQHEDRSCSKETQLYSGITSNSGGSVNGVHVSKQPSPNVLEKKVVVPVYSTTCGS
jgi:hypothetical protein